MFFNQSFEKSEIKRFLFWFYQKFGYTKTSELADSMKQMGFQYATYAGMSLGIDDLTPPADQPRLVSNAQNEGNKSEVKLEHGSVTAVERFQKLIHTWSWTSDKIKHSVIHHFRNDHKLNPLSMMAFSGARGNISQVRQLVGIRGLMADPQGNLLDLPIKSNFRTGLSILEYIISCYGSRKGIVDTALNTASSGYLTRRLVEACQGVTIHTTDCGTEQAIWLNDVMDHDSTVIPVTHRVTGRVLASGTECVTSFESKKICANKSGILVRSGLTCETKNSSVCQVCYGWNSSQQKLVCVGEAVGIIAAQSIGEPGTQLTMRTFHTGGVFDSTGAKKIVSCMQGSVRLSQPVHKSCTKIRTQFGENGLFTLMDVRVAIVNSECITMYDLPKHCFLFVCAGETVDTDQVIAQTKPNHSVDSKVVQVNSECSGQILFEDVSRYTHDSQASRSSVECFTPVHRVGSVAYVNQWVSAHSRKSVPTHSWERWTASHPSSLWVLVGTKHKSSELFLKNDKLIGSQTWNEVRTGFVQLRGSYQHGRINRSVQPNGRGSGKHTYLLLNSNVLQTHERCAHFVGQVVFSVSVQIVTQVQRDRVTTRQVKPYLLSVGASSKLKQWQLVNAGDPLFELPYSQQKTGDIVQGLPKIEQFLEAKKQNANKHNPKSVSMKTFFLFRKKGISPLIATFLSLRNVQNICVHSIQRVYKSHGIQLCDNHIEILVRRISSQVLLVHPAKTNFLPGEILPYQFASKCADALFIPYIVGMTNMSLTNSFLCAASFQQTRRVLSKCGLFASIDYLDEIKQPVMVGKTIPAGIPYLF